VDAAEAVSLELFAFREAERARLRTDELIEMTFAEAKRREHGFNLCPSTPGVFRRDEMTAAYHLRLGRRLSHSVCATPATISSIHLIVHSFEPPGIAGKPLAG